MSLHVEDDPSAPLYKQMYSSTTYTFNLRDIDPNSIKTWQLDSQHGGLSCNLDPNGMTCDLENMEFQTRNKAPLIDEASHTVFPKLQGRDHEADRKTKTFVAVFFFNDVEYASRFVKAFRHAVTLCGGKPSPF